MLVKASPKVIALMQAKAAELQAATRRANSETTLLRCAGGGLVLCGLAVVVYAGCLGYAKTQEPDVKAAQAYMAALKTPVKVEVTTHGEVTGQVSLLPATVGLDPHATVGVSPDSTVRVDPHSTVRAVTDAPRLSPEQLQLGARPLSKAAVRTEVVEFKEADFGVGRVETGWRFTSAADAAPREQFCQYIAPDGSGAQTLVLLGRGGEMTLPASQLAGVDLKAAFQNCVWWQDSRTPGARARVNRQDGPPPSPVITARKG